MRFTLCTNRVFLRALAVSHRFDTEDVLWYCIKYKTLDEFEIK